MASLRVLIITALYVNLVTEFHQQFAEFGIPGACIHISNAMCPFEFGLAYVVRISGPSIAWCLIIFFAVPSKLRSMVGRPWVIDLLPINSLWWCVVPAWSQNHAATSKS